MLPVAALPIDPPPIPDIPPEEVPIEVPEAMADAAFPIPPIPAMSLPEADASGIEEIDLTAAEEEEEEDETDKEVACADEAEKRFSANCSS